MSYLKLSGAAVAAFFVFVLSGCSSMKVQPYRLDPNVAIPSSSKALTYLKSHVVENDYSCDFAKTGVRLWSRGGKHDELAAPYKSVYYTMTSAKGWTTLVLATRSKPMRFCWVTKPTSEKSPNAATRLSDGAALLAALSGLGVQAFPESEFSYLGSYWPTALVETTAFGPLKDPRRSPRRAKNSAPMFSGNPNSPCNRATIDLVKLADRVSAGCQYEFDYANNVLRRFANQQIGFRDARYEVDAVSVCGNDIESAATTASYRIDGLGDTLRRNRCMAPSEIPAFVSKWSSFVDQSKVFAKSVQDAGERMNKEVYRIDSELSSANAQADVARRRAAMQQGLAAMQNTANAMLAERARTMQVSPPAPIKSVTPVKPVSTNRTPYAANRGTNGKAAGRCAVNGYAGAERSVYWNGGQLSCGDGSTPRVDGESGFWAGLTCSGDTTGPIDEVPRCSAAQYQQALRAAGSLVPADVARKYNLPQ